MNILGIGIHPDDIELGCGGTAALGVAQGHKVTLIDLSDGAASTNGTRDERARESQDAAAIIGVARENLGLPDTGIHSEDPGQTRRVVEAVRAHRPDVILAPSSDDPHPDHASGGALVKRAVYLAGLRGYDAAGEPWHARTVMVYGGRLEIEPQLIVDISSTHQTKMRAIAAHRSQFLYEDGRERTVLNAPEFIPAIEARDRLFGKKIRTDYGEAFRMLYPIGISDLSRLQT